jgi:hypothetical protein
MVGLLLLFLGFALGYGVREFLSRRRRAAERQRYARQQEAGY